MQMQKELDTPFTMLKLTYGLVPIVAGLDKFTNLLVDWKQYLSPVAVHALPVSPATFMMIVGVIEIIAGLLVLGRTRLGAYVVSAWLVGIALNLVTTGHYLDVAVRDLVMSVGAFALAKLAEARERDSEPVGARAFAPAHT
jgi:uncharacterized membrane protein YphA (DoxX/SURF4 family)